MVPVAELVPAVIGVSTGGAELLQQCLVCEPEACSVVHFHCGSCGLAEAEALIMSFEHGCWGGNKVKSGAAPCTSPAWSWHAGTARVGSQSPDTAWPAALAAVPGT